MRPNSSKYTMSRYFIILWLFSAPVLCLAAEDDVVQQAAQQVSSQIDQKVQSLKQDVLDLSSELLRIEQQLLFPAETHVTVFLLTRPEQDFVLEAVRIEIDGELIASHLYSQAEREALDKGGIQKLYNGNLASGLHTIKLGVIGHSSHDEAVNLLYGYEFEKTNKAGVVKLQIGAAADNDAVITFSER